MAHNFFFNICSTQKRFGTRPDYKLISQAKIKYERDTIKAAKVECYKNSTQRGQTNQDNKSNRNKFCINHRNKIEAKKK